MSKVCCAIEHVKQPADLQLSYLAMMPILLMIGPNE